MGRHNYIPFDLCIETAGGRAAALVLRGSPLPATRRQDFTTADNNQSEVSLALSAGPSPYAKNNVAIGSLSLTDIPDSLAGKPQIRIDLRVDCSLNIELEIACLLDGTLHCKNKALLHIDNDKILLIESMMDGDLEEHRKDRELVTASDDLRELVRQAEDHLFTSHQTLRKKLTGLIAEAGPALESADLKSILDIKRKLSSTIPQGFFGWFGQGSTTTFGDFLGHTSPPKSYDITAISLQDKVHLLKRCVIGISTNDSYDGPAYPELRASLIGNPRTSKLLPESIRNYRSRDEIWEFIKNKFSRYAERREYWRTEFDPLLTSLESGELTPSANSVEVTLSRGDLMHVREVWKKSYERRIQDPEGALTSARSLIESTCKHILDECGEPYKEGTDLRTLYREAAKKLNLAPEQHAVQALKQILQGCVSVVEGLATLRSVLGDAHGKSKKAGRPLPIHAELGVNLAGAICTFLLETSELRKKSSAKSDGKN